MLQAIPKGLFSNDYEIYDGDTQVAFLDPSAWREKAELEIEGRRYHLDREGWVGLAPSYAPSGLRVFRAS